MQLISRAQLAPFFAAANVVAALMMAANLWESVAADLAAAVAGAVAVVNLGAMQLARTQSITCVGRSGRRVPDVAAGRRSRGRAPLVWLSLPLYLFPSLDPARRSSPPRSWPASASARSAWSSIPPCATAWMVAFTAGVAGALLLGRHTVPFQHMLSIVFTLGVSIFGVLTVARWAFHQLKTNADVGSQSESASLLLQEYEQRGVGWLWQIDGENRVTYISSRMSALLGKPGQRSCSAIRFPPCSAAMPSSAACCSRSSRSTRSKWS